ncbi:ABC transporter ATP-binding protein [Desulforegula conservatrix]|uniref:ABC transporter ATP-binding protein n=1 Tax=Desulforegula conservatrix TaxID=153026 RepID=UPI0004205A3E|nr:ABC transporter ATP-binding protein [Desulforegula conservatrix]
MDTIITKGLTKKFGDLAAVENLSINVAEGECFGLVGPDGAGKTTTMRLLTSIMDPTSGDAWIDGLHIVKDSEAIKGKIGYMSQKFGLYPDLTVMENLNFYADIYCVPQKGRKEKIENLLSFSNLTPFKKRQAGRLSGGMKQKLGLACALIHTPRILFLDEPTNGVDPVSRRDFWKILYQLLKQKVTIFVSTSYLDEAERCNRLALIHKGNLIASGTPALIKKMMPSKILEISTLYPRKTAGVLKQNFTCADISLFGDRVHFSGTNISGDVENIESFLSNSGIEIKTIREIEPTLEDVFVSALKNGSENY